MPYGLLKEYGIAPLRTGEMARGQAHHPQPLCCHQDGVPRQLVCWVFVPYRAVPASVRREVVTMLDFLDHVMRTTNWRELADKAAVIVAERYMNQLEPQRVVPSRPQCPQQMWRVRPLGGLGRGACQASPRLSSARTWEQGSSFPEDGPCPHLRGEALPSCGKGTVQGRPVCDPPWGHCVPQCHILYSALMDKSLLQPVS